MKFAEYKYTAPYADSETLILPAACDIDKDGNDEIVFVNVYVGDPHPENSKLTVLKYSEGSIDKMKDYEIPLINIHRSIPQCGDIDGDDMEEIIIPAVGSSSPDLYVIKPQL